MKQQICCKISCLRYVGIYGTQNRSKKFQEFWEKHIIQDFQLMTFQEYISCQIWGDVEVCWFPGNSLIYYEQWA